MLLNTWTKQYVCQRYSESNYDNFHRHDICIFDQGLRRALAYILKNLGVTEFAHLPSAVCAINCATNGLVEYYIQIVKP